MNRKHQKGIVLVISLVMMVVLTMFVLSSTRLATGNLRIIGNVQAKKEVEALAQQGVEDVISNIAPFYSPTAAYTVTFAPPTGRTVTVGNRTCIRSGPAPGFSAVAAVAFEDTYWNVNVTAADAVTGAGTVVNQGVRIRLLKGNCP